MGVVGSQEFWVVGSRFYFSKEGKDDWVDLGLVNSITPNITIEKLELDDPDGGVKKTVAEAITKIDESYDITVSNLNTENLSYLLLGGDLTEFTQAGGDKLAVSHAAVPGRLFKIHDSDTAKTKVYGLRQILGVASTGATTATLTETVAEFDKSAGTITFSADVSAILPAGAKFIVRTDGGMADFLNAGTYEVASVGTTVVTCTAATAALINSSETGLTSTVLEFTTPAELYIPTVDWDAKSVDRGFIRMIEGGAFAAAANVDVFYSLNALSGDRKFTPQGGQEIKGEGVLTFGRGNNAEQSVREIPSLSISPSSADFSADDFSSIVLTVKVLSDTTSTESAGIFLHFKGEIPTKS